MSTSYQQAKATKRDEQLQALELARLQVDVGLSLHQRWPDKLPKAVRAAIQSSELLAWRAQRQAWTLARTSRIMDELEEDDLHHQRLQARHSPALLAHGATARHLLAVLQGLTGGLTLTIHTRPPAHIMDLLHEAMAQGLDMDAISQMSFVIDTDNGEQIETTLPVEMLQPRMFRATSDEKGQFGPENRDAILVAEQLANALTGDSSLVVRQTLPLRVMRPDSDGVMQWTHQEKLFMAHLVEGRVEPLTLRETREAYETDSETGEPLPPTPGTQYGELGPLLRKARPKMG